MKTKKCKKLLCGVMSLLAVSCLAVGAGSLSPLAIKTANAATLTLSTSLVTDLNKATVTTEKSHSSTFADGTKLWTRYNKTNKHKFVKTSFTGLTVESDEAYSASFNGTFDGTTQLNFKFPGSATDTMAQNTNYRIYENGGSYTYSVGNGAGDFYFKVTSVADASHTFTYRMANVNNKTKQYVEAVDSGTTIYSTYNKSSKVAKKYTYLYKLGSNSTVYNETQDFDFFNNSESTNLSGQAVNSIYFKFAPNSDGNWVVSATRCDTTGVEQGTSSAYYYKFSGNYAVFDGSVMPDWDFSEGYTIEFGSRYASGSDICFTSISANFTENPVVTYGAKVVGLDGAQIGETYEAGATVDLSAPTVASDKEFIGWNINGALYPAGYEYVVPDNLTQDMTITAVGVDFDLQAGASVRAKADGDYYGGLRFTTAYNTADVSALTALNATANFGTIIAPKDLLNGAMVTKDLTDKLDLPAEKFLTSAEAGALLKEDYVADNTYFTGTITNLLKANYSREFSARAYLTVTYADESTATVYCDYTETRSALYVAEQAKLANETGEVLDAYIAGVAKLTATVDAEAITFEGNVTVTENESIYTVTGTVYSLVINGVRISMAENATTDVKVGEQTYTVSNVVCGTDGAIVSFSVALKS